MQISIRLADLKDAASIAELSQQLGYSVPTGETRKKLNEILQQENHVVFVAVREERVAGWIHGFYLPRLTSEPFAEIAAMVVDENQRKQGIGKLLCKAVIRWAKEKGIKSLRVRCNIVRTDTHQFYQKLGFVEKKEQKVLDLRIT